MPNSLASRPEIGKKSCWSLLYMLIPIDDSLRFTLGPITEEAISG